MNKDLSRFILLIPSYCPPESLPRLIDDFERIGFNRIVVVNDGSPEEYEAIFQSLKRNGLTLLRNETNSGKGIAQKLGYEHILKYEENFDFVLNCDDDGQHHPDDAFKLIASASPGSRVYLGVRSFKKDTPVKSLIGNYFMCCLFFILTGKKLQDTQTGMRCFHRSLMPWLISCSASGFNYETICLLNLIIQKEAITEIPIQTIYFNENKSTRFRSIVDSIKVVFSMFFYRFKIRSY